MNGALGTPVRVVYDDPYYWNVFINKSALTKYSSGSGQKKMCLDLSDFYATREKEQLKKQNEKITTNEMGAYILSILSNGSPSCEQCK
jgi:hypothetical protein